ncbi:MAG: hypothetical protein DRI61_05620 [Chloroflexi bacterium]|nr:MAG: hypothetical protein DRI61_05620 [Chloroflexota bacterium]
MHIVLTQMFQSGNGYASTRQSLPFNYIIPPKMLKKRHSLSSFLRVLKNPRVKFAPGSRARKYPQKAFLTCIGQRMLIK